MCRHLRGGTVSIHFNLTCCTMFRMWFFLIFLLFPLNSFANSSSDFEFSGDVGYFSNYMSRGISQTGNDPAFMSNFKLEKQEGIHFKISAAQFDNVADPDTKEDVEVGYDVGHKSQLEHFTIDIGLTYYDFPGAVHYVNYNFFEGYLDVSSSYEKLEFGNVVFVSDNNFYDSGKSLYYNIYAKYPVLRKLFLRSSVGYQEIEKPVPFGSGDAFDWLIGFDYEPLESILLQIFYTGNNIDDDFCGAFCDETLTAGAVIKF